MTLWMLVSNDKYELPVAVFDKCQQLADFVGVPVGSITSAITHSKQRGHKCRYVKIKVDDDKK